MRKFLSKIAIFSGPLIIFLIWLACRTYDPYFAYHYLEKNCGNRAAWMYQRIFVDEAPVDIAFIGSSRTFSVVRDDLLEKNLGLSVVNLGYCGMGRNLHYTIVKDLLNQKKVQHLILEVRSDEFRFSHPMFPYLAQNRDVFQPVLFF